MARLLDSGETPPRAEEDAMTTNDRFQDEMARLRTLRDELRVQANLAAKEVRDHFEETEKRWEELESHVRGVGRESRDAMRDLGEAGRNLLHEIRHAYERIRGQL